MQNKGIDILRVETALLIPMLVFGSFKDANIVTERLTITLAEMGESSSSSYGTNSSAGGVGILIFILIVIFNSPGMLLLSVIREVFIKTLDRGQMWVFSLLTSLATLLILRLTLYGWSKAFLLYLSLSAIISIVASILYLGFRVDFVIRSVHNFF